MSLESLTELYAEALRLTEAQGFAIARADWDALEQLLADRQNIIDQTQILLAGIRTGDPGLDSARSLLRDLLERESRNLAAMAQHQEQADQRHQHLRLGSSALARYRVTDSDEPGSWYIDDAR